MTDNDTSAAPGAAHGAPDGPPDPNVGPGPETPLGAATAAGDASAPDGRGIYQDADQGAPGGPAIDRNAAAKVAAAEAVRAAISAARERAGISTADAVYITEEGVAFRLRLHSAGMQFQSTPQGVVATIQGKVSHKCPDCGHPWPVHDPTGCHAQRCGGSKEARCTNPPPTFDLS